MSLVEVAVGFSYYCYCYYCCYYYYHYYYYYYYCYDSSTTILLSCIFTSLLELRKCLLLRSL